MIPSIWLNRHISGALVASLLGLSMIVGCGYVDYDNPESKAIPISNTSDPTIKAHSISGTVGIADDKDNDHYGYEDSKPKSCRPIANIVVRAFQWYPKEDAKEYDEYEYRKDNNQAATNAKFGHWQLAGTTTTNNKGHYTLEGVLIPGHATFVEAISVCRPADPMLPTTSIIADSNMQKEIRGEPGERHYGNSHGGDYKKCPEGFVCEEEYDDDGSIRYVYPLSPNLTKDDRIIYAFRQTLIGEVLSCAVPKPPKQKDKCYGTYDGNSNPVINIILEDETEAGITSEDWYSRTSCTPSFKSDHSLKVGTAIADIIEYINNIILSGCKDNKNLVKGTLIDLHYYPDISSFGKEYNHKIGQFNDANMPTKFDKYTSTHYYAALSPYMHLKRCAGECYPQRFKEFLLKSGLFRQGNKNEFRDLRREAIDENEAGPGDMRKNNCYKWLSNY